LGPDDHGHDAARLERGPHVSKPLNRVLEKLGAEAREAEVVHRLESKGLGVALDEGDVRDPGGLGVGAADLEERAAAVDAEHRAGRADLLGQLNGRVAEAAADVHHRVALADLEGRKDLGAVVREAVHQDVAVLDEFGDEDLVPEIDELVASLGGFGRAHDPYLSRLLLPDRP
jgi:hypothetical protein